MYQYKGKMVYVVDGDTFDIVADLGFFITHMIRVRLKDLDTAEIYRPENKAELEHGQEARDFIRGLVEKNPDVIITTYKEKASTFGRFVADVQIHDERGEMKDLKGLLMERGFAKLESYSE
jgi:endonuclease YncB( thermonuclease family)